MNISSKRLFPNPVVWFANDDYNESDFSILISHEQSFGKFNLIYDIQLNNKELLSRIDEGDAAFCIHIECSMTMFRFNYMTSKLTGRIEINEEDIAHRVEVLPLIVAITDIHDYKNNKLNEDYSGITISIKKGTIMGVSDYQYYIVDKEKTDLGKKESIFSFVKNQKKEPMQFEINDDRIIIKLKDADFNKLQMLQASSKFQPVVFSMFIVPALIFAFDTFAYDDLDVENYRDFLWFRSLEKCFESNGLKLDKPTIQQKTSFGLAQLLLEDPISHALTALNEGGEY